MKTNIYLALVAVAAVITLVRCVQRNSAVQTHARSQTEQTLKIKPSYVRSDPKYRQPEL